VKVRGMADTLSDAATIARRGADQLDYLKHQAIEAIEEAREAGLIVGENLSVTDTGKYNGLRVAAVRRFAAMIAARAAALSTADKDIAARISAATSELSDRRFSESPENVQASDVLGFPRFTQLHRHWRKSDDEDRGGHQPQLRHSWWRPERSDHDVSPSWGQRSR